MPRSTSLETAVSLSLLLGFTACSFGGSDGEEGEPELDFTFLELEGLKYDDKRSFTAPMMTINTSQDSACSEIIPADATGTPELCVISAKTITIDPRSIVRVTGKRPLVLASSGTLQVGGTLDVSSTRATMDAPEAIGAGAPSATCTPFARDVLPLMTGGSGGAGGSFVGSGGNGGNGSNTDAPGGRTNPMIVGPTIALRGGCRGQTGGGADNHPQGQPPGAGGAGGGALYLAAGGNLTVLQSAKIAANGAGGGGGGAQAGGGGGGSGGVVVLEALGTITYSGLITAKGGGGGGGGYVRAADSSQNPGSPGQDGAASLTAATGGPGLPTNSGNGAAAPTDYQPALDAGSSAYGGGGGGGGNGVIHLVAPTLDVERGTFSPPRR